MENMLITHQLNVPVQFFVVFIYARHTTMFTQEIFIKQNHNVSLARIEYNNIINDDQDIWELFECFK